jgi:hypothetical protein
MRLSQVRLALQASTGVLCLAAIVLAATTETKQFSPAQRRWWAIQPVNKSAIPAVKDAAWVRNEVDAFILAKLDSVGLKPNPPADKSTLIRRVSLDLTGLPPTPEEVQSFVADQSPDAWSRVVERLLASPRYGERWGRHWLDLARYADSEGFKSDETRPNIWRYRDYVIRSFNEDKPYDRFVREQIAGDELYPNDPAALVATGFNRHFPDESNARNLMQRRQEILNDITDVTGYTFMGVTIACAKCHDHKFDPILQKAYYRLQAYFANTRIEDHAALISGAERERWQRQFDDWDAKTKDIRAQMHELVKPKLEALYKENFDKFPEEIQAAITTPADQRTPIQWHMYYKAKPQIEHSDQEAAAKLKGEDLKRFNELKAALAKFDYIKPPELPVAQAMIDNASPPPKEHILGGGLYENEKGEVQPGPLSIIDPSDATITPPAGLHSSGRRSALALWLTNPSNPLTARVMVNRIWHYHFGRGIVGTPSDFGMMGERPANKDLLDYLTVTFVEKGWSVKQMHRLILNSNTYRQSSEYREDAAKVDPTDKYVWRYNRHRLEGESIRDSMLYVSGLLNTKMFGPGVFPPLPFGINPRGGWKKNEDPSEAARRSVYIFVRRNTRYPMLESFDMPDTHESCARRNNTVTPTQALDLLNNDLVLDWSRKFAARVMNDSGMTPEAQVERAFKLALQREPTQQERQIALAFLNKQQSIAGDRNTAMADFCHMLLNTNEFVYVN